MENRNVFGCFSMANVSIAILCALHLVISDFQMQSTKNDWKKVNAENDVGAEWLQFQKYSKVILADRTKTNDKILSCTSMGGKRKSEQSHTSTVNRDGRKTNLKCSTQKRATQHVDLGEFPKVLTKCDLFCGIKYLCFDHFFSLKRKNVLSKENRIEIIHSDFPISIRKAQKSKFNFHSHISVRWQLSNG